LVSAGIYKIVLQAAVKAETGEIKDISDEIEKKIEFFKPAEPFKVVEP